MKATLIEVIDRLDEVDDSDRFDSQQLFAEGGPDATSMVRAVVCRGGEVDSKECPEDDSLSYVLTVWQAKEAIEVWSEWRGGRQPTPEEKLAAVMHYSRFDAWLPVES